MEKKIKRMVKKKKKRRMDGLVGYNRKIIKK